MTDNNREIAFVVLAAGKGTRMKNTRAKVMHPLAGKTIIEHVLNLTRNFEAKKIITVISPDMKDTEELIRMNYPKSKIIYQTERLGTGHAVKICLDDLTGFNGTVVILYGDTPFIKSNTIKELVGIVNVKSEVCILGFNTNSPNQYGRLIIDKNNDLKEIIEYKEATPEQKNTTLCNSGVMAFNSTNLDKIINKIDNNNSRKEYYLTDAVKIANDLGLNTKAYITDEYEVIGINSQQERAMAEKLMQEDIRQKHLDNGVIIIAPETVFFSKDTSIAPGVIIEPFVVFKGKVTIAAKCEIRSYSHIEDSNIAEGSIIGPYARLRPGTEIGENARIGNFVEIKKSKIGKGSKVNHLSYIGDTEMGNDVNIGAGTITCNYDGKNKHRTIIGDSTFVGSNTEIIAPINIGANSVIGAGTTLIDDVPEGKTIINEKKQKYLDKK